MNTYIDSPYINIPNELLKDYTMDGKIPILNLWVDVIGLYVLIKI